MEGFVRRFLGMIIGLMLLGELWGNPHHFPYRQELAGEIQFWKRIFTEFSRHQYVLHDSEYPFVIYKVVTLDSTVSHQQRRRILNREKQRVKTILERLHRYRDRPEALSEWERKIWRQFRAISEPDKFLAASQRIRAQQGIRENFYQGVLRSQAYLEYIRKVFQQMGLPEELCYLPHMESSFNPGAVSKVGAVGMWQFMRATARWYMKVNSIIDQRWDPFASTHAAARLLKHNYEELDDWALAITAYNYGLAGMKKAKRQHGKDYLKIRQNYLSRRFGFASRNFYPEFLAVVEIMDSLQHYYPDLVRVPSFTFHEMVLPEPVNLKRLIQDLNLDPEKMKVLNAGYRKKVWMGRLEIPAGYPLRLPREVAPETVYAYLERQKGRRGQVLLATRQPRPHFPESLLETLRQLSFTNHKLGVAEGADVNAERLILRQGTAAEKFRVRGGPHKGPGGVLGEGPVADPAMPAGPSPDALLAYLEDIDRLNRWPLDPSPLEDAGRRGFRDVGLESAGLGLTPKEGEGSVGHFRALARALMRNQNPRRWPSPAPIPVAREELPALASVIHRGGAPVGRGASPTQDTYWALLETSLMPSGSPQPLASSRRPPADERSLLAASSRAPLFRQRASFSVASTEVLGPAFGPNSEAEGEPWRFSQGATDLPTYGENIHWGEILRLMHQRLQVDGGYINVFPGETLGHYAEWLRVPVARLRRLNGLGHRSRILIGQRLRLDFSQVTEERFLTRRVAFHARLLKQYLPPGGRYRLVEHPIRPGETLWSLAHKKYKFPVNLLLYFNDLNKLRRLYPGERIKVLIRER